MTGSASDAAEEQLTILLGRGGSGWDGRCRHAHEAGEIRQVGGDRGYPADSDEFV